MNIKPIRNDDDLRVAFKQLERIFQVEAGTPAADEMEVLVTLIQSYEQKHFRMGVADPVDAIKFRMEQQGLSPKDLEPCIGTSGRVSEVLNRKRRLSLTMVQRLHEGLRIPYESLLSAADVGPGNSERLRPEKNFKYSLSSLPRPTLKRKPCTERVEQANKIPCISQRVHTDLDTERVD